MNKHDWFILIQQWRLMGMGVYGVTLPFLVGALGLINNISSIGAQQVRAVLDEIINHPVNGFVTAVRWCGDIDAPVFTIESLEGAANRQV